MYTSGKKCPSAGMKLAPPIQNASIARCEKRVDQKTWFIIRVVPQQGVISNSKRPVSRQPYFVARRYEDFIAFNQRLHEAFPTSARSLSSLAGRAGSRAPDTIALPKLNGKRLNLLQNKKQVHIQRRADLEKFISSLFTMPPSISQSLVVLEFFGLQDTDVQVQATQSPRQRLSRSQSSIAQEGFFCSSQSLRKSASHPDLVTTNEIPDMTGSPSAIPNRLHPLDHLPSQLAEKQQASSSPLWKRFKTRARGHATPASPGTPLPQPTISSSSLTSFCSQAASRIMPWASRGNVPQQQQQQPCSTMPPAPSYSTPVYPPVVPPKNNCRYQYRYPPTRVAPMSVVTSSSIISSTSSSSQSSHDSQSTCATSIAPSPTISPTLRTIKIKVIYDVDNIIVIQVPRSVTLSDLRARIAQKFCDPAIALPHNFVLLYNDTRSSASSNTSAASSLSVDSSSGTATIISKESDLAKAMGTMWVRLEKVTLRCIA